MKLQKIICLMAITVFCQFTMMYTSEASDQQMGDGQPGCPHTQKLLDEMQRTLELALQQKASCDAKLQETLERATSQMKVLNAMAASCETNVGNSSSATATTDRTTSRPSNKK